MGFEILHEWSPKDTVRWRLAMGVDETVVVGFMTSSGQRVRLIRSGDRFHGRVDIMCNALNLSLRVIDGDYACEESIDWLRSLPLNLHVDDVFEKCPRMSWLTWWFDEYHPKSDEAAQLAMLEAKTAWHKALRGGPAEIGSPMHTACLSDFKDAVRDFMLPALRAFAITYNPDRPYIR